MYYPLSLAGYGRTVFTYAFRPALYRNICLPLMYCLFEIYLIAMHKANWFIGVESTETAGYSAFSMVAFEESNRRKHGDSFHQFPWAHVILYFVSCFLKPAVYLRCSVLNGGRDCYACHIVSTYNVLVLAQVVREKQLRHSTSDREQGVQGS